MKRARAEGGSNGGIAGERLQALLASSTARDIQDEVRNDAVPGLVLGGGSSSSSSSSESSSSSSDDEEDTAVGKTDGKADVKDGKAEGPLFDDVLAPPTSSTDEPQLTISINPSQPLAISLPPTIDASNTPTEPPIYTYPPSCIPLKFLPEKTQQIKLARFLPCQTKGCGCTGLKPPGWGSPADPAITAEGTEDVSEQDGQKTGKIILWTSPSDSAVDIQGLEALDPLARTITEERLWDTCGACGCRWSDEVVTGNGVDGEDGKKGEGKNGHTVSVAENGADGGEGVDKDEVQRRRRVAHRAEEMLEVRPVPWSYLLESADLVFIGPRQVVGFLVYES